MIERLCYSVFLTVCVWAIANASDMSGSMPNQEQVSNSRDWFEIVRHW